MTIAESIIGAGKELVKEGLIVRTWGNVSSRIDENRFLITASGRDYQTLREEELVQIHIADFTYTGAVKPSSELQVHGEIYRQHPEAKFIIHTHQENASALSAMGAECIALDLPVLGIGKTLYCSDYGPSGSRLLAGNVAKTLRTACGQGLLMKNHGVICFGESAKEVFSIAKALEAAAEIYLRGCSKELETAQQYSPQKMEDGVSLLNCDDLTIRLTKERADLPAYIDDYAQIVGSGADMPIKLLPGKGILCQGKTLEESEILFLLVRKNCKAYFAAKAVAEKNPKAMPLDDEAVAAMHNAYIHDYSLRI
ncbi:MAG: class II aldolase/adducin family protein [Anaerovoracaceae bacterium]